METINKHNYEIFFIDFLDGNLSQEKMEELSRFLKKNPSLKEELENFEDISLEPEEVIFENKQDLIKKTQAQHFEITEFEYLCVAETEKDITGEEAKQLKFELKNSENKKAYKLFQNLNLKADEHIVFAKKKLLLKKTIPINYRILSTLAAAVILLFFVFKGNFLNQNTNKLGVKQYSSKLNNEIDTKPVRIEKTLPTDDKNIKQEQTLVAHNQTIKNSNNHVLAFDDNEPQKMKDLYKELIVSIPDIKNEALISNTNQKIIPVVLRNSYAVTNNTPTNKKDKFWKYAEKGVGMWKKITKDDDVQLVNEYAENGSVNEVNFMASNFQFRKTYNKK